MADEIKFPNGLIVKEGNVDFCKAKLSFKVEEFKKYLDENSNNGWVNIDVLLSKGGKLYSALNEFKPVKKEEEEVVDGDFPF